MKISTIKNIQNEILAARDLEQGCATCRFFYGDDRKRYQELLEFYYTGENNFKPFYALTYLYFSDLFSGLSKNEKDQITYYRLFMLEIFKDVVRNEKI